MRTSKAMSSPPMTAETAEKLYAALDALHPGKVWREIVVCPVAVLKTIDNEIDALRTLKNIEKNHPK